MVSEVYKERAHNLVKEAKDKKIIKAYKEFYQTDIAKETELTEEEIAYYTSKKSIGGSIMNAIARIFSKIKHKADERYCSVYESLDESLKEVKLIKEGKTKPKTWDELYQELKHNEE